MWSQAHKLLAPFRIVRSVKPAERSLLTVKRMHPTELMSVSSPVFTRPVSFFSKSRATVSLNMVSRSIQSTANFDREDYNNHHNDENSGSNDKLSLTMSGIVIAVMVYSFFDSKKFSQHFTVQAARPVDCELNEYEKRFGRDAAVNTDSQTNVIPSSRTSRRQQFNIIADVVDSAAKAVVCISIKDHSMIDWFDGSPRTANTGSGFIIGEDGLILTNAHVINERGRTSIAVQLLDGRTFAGRVEAIDPESDLALIRIPARGLPVLNLGNSSDTRIGEWVCAIGSPLSLSNSVTAGVVSSVKRGASELGIRNNISYIQTDATITFGNSGGPLVNLDGEAIGINSMKVAPGISFAIPSDYVKQFLANVAADKKAGNKTTIRRYVGLTLVTLTDDIVAQLDQRTGKVTVNRGVLVWKVVVGSPAYLAGVVPGDIIVEVNAKKVVTAKDIYDAIKVSPHLHAVINRGGVKYQCIIHPEDIQT